MIRTDKAMVRILEVGLESDDCLSSQFFNLPLDMAYVSAASRQLLENIRPKLFRWVIRAVHEIGVCFLKFVRVLVKRIVGQVHVKVAQVHTIRFLVVLLKKERRSRFDNKMCRKWNKKEWVVVIKAFQKPKFQRSHKLWKTVEFMKNYDLKKLTVQKRARPSSKR